MAPLGSMTTCRTIAEIYAAAEADSANDPPLTREQADRIAAILAPHMDLLLAARTGTSPAGPTQQ
jgi:hypothetical protein